MSTLSTMSEEGAYGLVHPCIVKCADPCIVECCCAELGIDACAEYWACGETDTDPVCKPNSCNYWSEVRFYGLDIPACLTRRADDHGGLDYLEVYVGDTCVTASAMSPGFADREIALPQGAGSCASPTFTITREELMGYLCSTCSACADYKVALLFRALDDTVLLCCEFCLRLCDVLCPYGSSSSSSSSSPAPPP